MRRGYLPVDDPGSLMVIVQAPQGASLAFTQDICAKVEESVSHIPEVTGAFTVVGFSFTGNASNRAMVFLNLADFKDRKGSGHSGPAVVEKMRAQVAGIPGGLGVPVNTPSGAGWGQVRRFNVD